MSDGGSDPLMHGRYSVARRDSRDARQNVLHVVTLDQSDYGSDGEERPQLIRFRAREERGTLLYVNNFHSLIPHFSS